ncbi:MAG: putative Ig domain-containing protein [Verrucomicrobia bacterium]|nr:putative Ig domain-containing protein [Verrucomicrobiota bacterium]
MTRLSFIGSNLGQLRQFLLLGFLWLGLLPRTPAQTPDSSPTSLGRSASVRPAATLGQIGGADEYTFTVSGTERDFYVFDAQTSLNSLVWSLFGPEGTEVADRTFTGSDSANVGDTESVLKLAPGDYRLQVRSTLDQAPDYHFRLWRLADAPLLAPGAPVNAPLSPGNGTRIYQFTGEFGDQVRLQLTRTNLPSGASARLVDPFGRVVARASDGFSSPVTLLADGPYWVLVEGNIGNGTNAGSFGLNVEPLAPQQPYSTGQPLALNTRTFLTNSTPFTNVYRLTLTTGTQLAFHSLLSGSQVSWQLLGPAGNLGEERFTESTSKRWEAPAGEYQFTVWSRAENSGVAGWAFQDLSALTPLAVDTLHRITNAFNNDHLYFRLPLAAGQQIYAEARSVTGFVGTFSVGWTLWNPYGSSVFSQSWSDGGFTAPFSGDYILALRSAAANPGTNGIREFRFHSVTNSASPLAFNTVVADRITTPGQIRRYTFALDQSRRVAFDVLNSSEALWNLSGPLGSIDGARFWSDSWNIYPLPAGNYVITVRGNTIETPEFAFRLLDLGAAEVITLGDTVAREFTPAGGTWAFRLNLTAGQRFYPRLFNFSGFPAGVPQWRLEDPAGRVVFSTSVNTEPGALTAPATGTYTLIFSGSHLEPLTRTGQIEFALLPITDTLTPIALGTEINDSIQSPGQTRRYTFEVTQPTRVSFDILESSNARFRLLGPSGTLNSGSRFWQDSWWIYELIPGAYTVETYADGNETPPARFQILAASAGPKLTLNSTNRLEFPTARHSRWVRFDLTAGQRFYADPLERTTWNTSRPGWTLRSPSGDSVFDTSFTPQAPFEVPFSGTYDLLIGGNLSEPSTPASATFTLRTAPENAQPLILGVDIAAALTLPGEVHRYEFTLSNDTWLTFNSLSDSNLRWALTGPWGALAGTRFWNNSWQPLQAPAGQYTLEVFGDVPSVGSYRFRLIDIFSGPTLNLGEEVQTTFNPNASTVVYALDLPAGQRVNARFLSRTGLTSGPLWTLVDPNGIRLFESSSTANSSATTVLAGRHALMLVGPTADAGVNGSIRFILDDGGVTPPAAWPGTPITWNQEVSGTLPEATTTNQYTFTLTEKAMLHVDMLAGSGQLVTLRNRHRILFQDRTLTQVDLAASSSWSMVPAEPGDYQLEFRGAGTIRFRLLNAISAPTLVLDADLSITNAPANASQLRRFTGQAGDRLQFLGGTFDGFDQRPSFAIWDPKGDSVYSWFSNTEATLTLSRTGEYYLLFGVPVSSTAPEGVHRVRLATIRSATNSLALNTPTTGAVTSPLGSVQYDFVLTAPTRVAVDLIQVPAGSHSMVWNLKSPDRTWRTDSGLNSSDISSTPSVGNAFFDLPAGPYSLSFRLNASTIPGPFRFAVWDLEAVAQPQNLNTVIQGTNQPAAQSRFYRFDIPAGTPLLYQGLGFSGYSDNGFADLYFPNGDGRDLWRLDRIDDRFLAPVTGRYYLLASGLPNDTGTNGTFQFALWSPQDRTNTVALGTPVNDALTIFSERSNYRLNLPQDALLLFDLLGEPVDLSLTLRGDLATPFSNVAVRSHEANDSSQLKALPAGEYLATFSQPLQQTNAFRFRFLDAAQAPAITPGQPVTVNFSEPRSTEVVRFSAQAGDRFYLRFDETAGFTALGINTRMFAATGALLFQSDSRFDVTTFTAPFTGSYYFVLNGENFAAGQQGSVQFTLLPVVPTTPQPLFETGTAGPDLEISALTATPNSVLSGGIVTVQWTARNRGLGAVTNAFSDRVVIRNAAGTVLATRLVTDATTGLAPQGTVVRSTTITLPDGPSATGDLEVEVSLDALNALAESNDTGTGEANNRSAVPLQGTLAPYPDLQVVGLRTTPVTGWIPGNSVTVTWNLTNSGTGPARATWTDRVTIINRTTGRPVATRDLTRATDLAAGASSEQTFEFTVPPVPDAFGQFTVTVLADVGNAVTEFSTAPAELNNSANLDVVSGPDLAVAELIVPNSAIPGVPFEVVTVITNRGSVTANTTWQNSLALSADNQVGGDTSLVFDSLTAELAPAESLRHTNRVAVPITGDAGPQWLVVRLDVGNAIPEANRANNVGVSTESIDVAQALTLVAASGSVPENSPNPLSLTLSRNGSAELPLTVAVTGSRPDELAVPDSVVIPAGQKSVTVPAQPLPDDLLDGPQSVQISASAEGFLPAQTTVNVLDSTAARLAVAFATNRVTEGGTLEAVISRVPTLATALVVQLQLSDVARVTGPRTITIPAGQASVPILLTVPQNLTLQAPLSVSLTATTAGYESGGATVQVLDDDLPQVTLAVSPRTVSEGGGPNAATVTLTRSPITAAPVTVTLLASRPDIISWPSSVTIPANVPTVSFPVGTVNNTQVDGPRATSLGGWIVESSGGTRLAEIVPDLLTITDDDGPALTLVLAADVVPEGRNPATTARLTRNTGTNGALVVTLESSQPEEAVVPASVVIPDGSSQVTFAIQTLDDGETDGNQSVQITATAAGFSTATRTLLVTDSNLPDLVVTRLTAPTNGIAGTVVPVSFRVENRGFAPITNGFIQSVRISESPVFGGGSLAAQLTWSTPVPAGGFLEQTANLRLPAKPGPYWIAVEADSSRQVTELVEANNIRISDAAVNAGASYLATVTAQPKVALANSPITLSGQATRASDGQPATNVAVEVHLEVRGIRRNVTVATDTTGRFSTVFNPLPDEAGNYRVAASFPGLPMPAAQDQFTLQGLRVTPVNSLRIVELSSVSSTTRLLNLSDLPLTGLVATVLSNSPGFEVSAQLATNRLDGDDEATLAFVVTANSAARGNGFAHLRVTSGEGAFGDVILPLVLERIVPRLVADRSPLTATMPLGQQRVVSFSATNVGGTATGPLEVVFSGAPWLTAVSPVQLPPLEPGANTSVDLLLSPAADLALNVYNGEVVLRATNALLRVPFSFRAVSEARGGLLVTAEDEYTYFAEGSPRPTNAVVVVSDALTGTVVANGEGGPDGEVLFENLLEGDYLVSVTADGHDSFRRTVRVAGINPADANPTSAAPFTSRVQRADATPAVTPVTAFLPRQSVRYTFSVVPTTIEDVYTFTIESTFETQVPKPVITIDPPSVDLTLFAEDEFQINFTISNHGLIAAQNVEFNLPSTADLQMTPLISKIGRMAARSSVNIPVLVHRGRPTSPSSVHAKTLQRAGVTSARRVDRTVGFGGCTAVGQAVYSYPCGPSEINGSAPVAFNVSAACNFLAVAAALGDSLAQAFAGFPVCCGPGDGGNGNYTYSPTRISSRPPVDSSSGDCSSGPGPQRVITPANSTATPRRVARAAEDPGSEGAVCAKVRLRLDQRAVLTRDAFQARLELGNDTDSSLTDLEVTLDIVDSEGRPANALFGVRPPELTGLTSVDGSGSLGAQSSGSARWTLIPSLDAAPTQGVRTFLVGGTIIYRQDGVRITVPLTPASIDVHPQPELVVRYFHERNVYSDDPFTRVLEPAVPYALAAQVLNVGYGTAKSLRIESGQPQIIENEKGLLIDFQAIGASVENRPFSPSLNADLGEIAPGTNRLARWFFTSSLQGSFTNFTATFRQEDAIAGVPRLSLVKSVEIHELIRIVQLPIPSEDNRADLLVNSTGDAAILPDTLYASDGNTYPVSAVTNAVITGQLSPSNLQLRLDVALPRGIAYLRVEEPGGTNYLLRQVLRPDGTDLGVGTNVWTTDRFIRGGAKRPIRINQLHLVDVDAPTHYTLVYEVAPPPIPDTAAPVSQVAALPAQSPLNFPVAWSGTDDSSGVFSYNIYVSIDSGPFQLWLTNSPLTGAIYSGASGRSYGFVASAIDRAGNIEAVRTVADTTTQITVSNRTPVLAGPAALTVRRGELLEAQFTADDPDPDQRVFFTMLPGAPRGLALDGETGTLRWQTGDSDVPGTFTVRVRATDNGLPSEFAQASVAVTLIATNRPPALTPVENLLVTEGSRLEQPIVVTDPDVPRQTIQLTLVQAPPTATLEADGIFRWRTRPTDGPSTNRIVIRATDNGTPPLSTELAFTVWVRDTTFDLLVGVGSTNLFLGDSASVPLSLNADPEITRVTFRLPLPVDRFEGLALSGLSEEVVSATVADFDADFALVQVQLRPGASLTATRRIADLAFTSVDAGESGIVPVRPEFITGLRGDGTAVQRSGADEGSIVLLGEDPILRLITGPRLTVFGHPGRTYRLQSAPNLTGPWTVIRTVTLTGDRTDVELNATEVLEFLRLVEGQ